MDIPPSIALLQQPAMRIALIVTVFIGFSGHPAQAIEGEWFRHPFGEMRAYFGDWLAVCPNEGRAPCRIVQIGLEPGESRVGPRRMALNSMGEGVYSIDVFQRDLPSAGLDPLVIVFDDVTVAVRPGQYRPGEFDHGNAAETLTFTDLDLAADLVDRMKEHNRMTIKHAKGDIEFSLRGVTDALNAIEAHQRGRGE